MKKMLSLIVAAVALLITLTPITAPAQQASEKANEMRVAQESASVPSTEVKPIAIATGKYNGRWMFGSYSDSFYIHIKKVDGASCAGEFFMTAETSPDYYNNRVVPFSSCTVVGNRLKIVVPQLTLDLAVKTEDREYVLDGTLQGNWSAGTLKVSKSR